MWRGKDPADRTREHWPFVVRLGTLVIAVAVRNAWGDIAFVGIVFALILYELRRNLFGNIHCTDTSEDDSAARDDDSAL